MQLPVLPQDGEARARNIIRGIIDTATESEPGISEGNQVVPGPDFGVTWRWVIEFSTVFFTDRATVLPFRIDFVFEQKKVTIEFDETQNRITVQLPSPPGVA